MAPEKINLTESIEQLKKVAGEVIIIRGKEVPRERLLKEHRIVTEPQATTPSAPAPGDKK